MVSAVSTIMNNTAGIKDAVRVTADNEVLDNNNETWWVKVRWKKKKKKLFVLFVGATLCAWCILPYVFVMYGMLSGESRAETEDVILTRKNGFCYGTSYLYLKPSVFTYLLLYIFKQAICMRLHWQNTSNFTQNLLILNRLIPT